MNNPIASDEDSDFVADGNGGAAIKWFYLPVPTEEVVKNNQLGYPQVDVGLVPVAATLKSPRRRTTTRVFPMRCSRFTAHIRRRNSTT